VKELEVAHFSYLNLTRAAWMLLCVAGLFGCKDANPCDPGQVSIGTACYPAASGGSGGGSSSGKPDAGAP
jgi:hypothetical protein